MSKLSNVQLIIFFIVVLILCFFVYEYFFSSYAKCLKIEKFWMENPEAESPYLDLGLNKLKGHIDENNKITELGNTEIISRCLKYKSI